MMVEKWLVIGLEELRGDFYHYSLISLGRLGKQIDDDLLKRGESLIQ